MINNYNRKALVNYYAILIKKGSYTLDDVDPEIKVAVEEKLKELPDLKEDAEVETLALGQGEDEVVDEVPKIAEINAKAEDVQVLPNKSPTSVTKDMIGL